ncbi:hypothetical protein D3C81_792130 [compost metagenome]
MDDRACTHRARLQRDVEAAVKQSPGPEMLAGLADRNHLGMGGTIVGALTEIVATSNDVVTSDDDRTNRHFADGFRFACFTYSLCHPMLVRIS